MINDLDNLIILVVEDHVFQRKALIHQIKSLGYQGLLEASSGEKALDICLNQKVDIIFCDLRMPGMDGMALLHKLSLSEFDGSIVISSILDNDVITAVQRMGESYSLKIIGRLEKPCSQTKLKEIIERHNVKKFQPKKNKDIYLTVEDLNRALEQDEFLPWFQPKVALSNGRWIGVEAFARWQHPIYGLLMPSDFIELAERHKLIGYITNIIVNKCLNDDLIWRYNELQLNVSMNIPFTSLIDSELCAMLIKHCKQSKIDPKFITLEITESAFTQDLGRSLEILTRLRMYGFCISIDDFGAGYSSLQQLALLPFTELKLDCSFIENCTHDLSKLAIIESSINLAKRLGLNSVAEGVEDIDTWKLLSQIGCDACQGYFSGYPMPSEQLQTWYGKWLDTLSFLTKKNI